MKRRWLLGGAVHSTLWLALAGGGALAQESFPNQPVTFIVNSAAGGALDLGARHYADLMSKAFGQPVVVENRVGGGGLIGIQHVINSRPDGHTILVTAGTVTIQQALRSNPGYAVGEDLVPVGMMMQQPVAFIAAAETPFQTFDEVVKFAEEKPGELSVATSGYGTTLHIGPEIFLVGRGLDVELVPYQGASAMFPDVIEGRVHGAFAGMTGATTLSEAGSVRILGVSSDKRLDSLPDIPTFAESGLPDYSYYIWMGFFAPAGTPDEVIDRLSGAILEAQKDTAFQEWVRGTSTELVPMTDDDFAAFVKKDLDTLDSFSRATGFSLD